MSHGTSPRPPVMLPDTEQEKAMKNTFSLIIFCFFLGNIHAQSVDFTSSNLPVIVINTNGRTIVDSVRVPADMGIIYNGPGQRNHIDDPWNHYNGRIAIELRGTWSQTYPKKPYRFETQDSLGNNLNVGLLGMPSENDWVLHNPYSDKSLFRNVLAFKILNDMGRYASRTRFCELIINGDYKGVYVLMEKLKRDRNRIDIAELDENAVTGNSLTGGYIIKIDKPSGEQVGGWTSGNDIDYQYHYPKPDDITPEQEEYIRNYMDRFETVMSSPDYDDPTTGYTNSVDIGSVVDQFIISEVSKNVDSYRASFFMYKDRDDRDGKLHLGPTWDHNFSFGNVTYLQGYMVLYWNFEYLYNELLTSDDFSPPYWLDVIWKDATFRVNFAQRWRQLRQDILHIDSLLAYIDLLVDTLDEAQQRNFKRWPVLDINNTYAKEIGYLKNWLTGRIDWIDESINTLTSVSANSENASPKAFGLERNYPVLFNSTTAVSHRLPANGDVELNIYNLLGQKVSTLISERQPAGDYKVEFNAGTLAGSAYFYRIEAGKFVQVNKLLLLK